MKARVLTPTNSEQTIIGLMSGTSLDGVDAVCAQFHASSATPTVLGHAFVPFTDAIRQDLLDLHTPAYNEIHHAQQVALALNTFYQAVVCALLEKIALQPSQIRALAVHGQTIRHQPQHGYTYQLLAPAHLAEHTGIAVICDFRSRDIAAGGQGAPLVPAFHQHFFSIHTRRAVLNLGGIANVSLIQANGTLIGFDTGPANMLLDAWCQLHTGQAYDAHGQWAQTGICHAPLLVHLLQSEPWLALPPPKSTGRDLFSLEWLQQRLGSFSHLAAADVQATLVAFTAETIANALASTLPELEELVLCGGGAYNDYLCRTLQQSLAAKITPHFALQSCLAFGIAPEQVEALAFAWLGNQFLQAQPANCPSVTGAKGYRVLGAYYP